MRTEIKSKHSIVLKSPYVLYMAFVDMRNFVNLLPPDKKDGITADPDSLHAVVQGFNVGVRIAQRTPYSRIDFKDDGAPFQFTVSLFFDPVPGCDGQTDFHIELVADLNLMMKMMLGSRLQEALNKIVDTLADVSAGKMPDGIDPSMFPEGLDPSKFSNGFHS